MSLTITIPGAVETTTGSTAPAVLTVGVGAPGQGVPSGGTTGQVLQKLSGVSYDTGWLTLPADYITSVTAPLAVTAGNLAVDLSAYLTSATAASTYQTLAGMSSYLTTATAATTYYPLSGNPSAFLVAADIAGKANLASPSFTGNVTISSSTGAALFIEQTGTGNILTLHDQASDTTFVTIDANGKVSTNASEATNGAGFNIAHGVAPTTPVNGDIWTTTSAVFARINAGTQQLMNLGSTQTVSGSITFSNASQTLGSSTATGTINVASGATISASTKTVNVATGGVSGSTTTTTIGPVLGASTTSIGNTTAASTLNLATGATLTATTKAVNIGTSGVAGSTTNIAIGSTTGTSTTTLQGTTNGITQTAADSTTALATTAFVTTADNLKANLASPTFTGTPTLPTGTIATTQSPGNNTTALATTAFVTAAVPLVATLAESQQLTSTTAYMSPFDTITAMMTEGYRPALGMTGGSTGTGAGANPIMPQYIGLGGPNSGVAGNCYAITNTAGGYITGVDPVSIKFNKPIWLSGSFRINTAGDSNNDFKAYIGTSMLNGNDPTGPSIGWYRQGGASMPISVMVHNGTTLTKVASASSFSSGSTAVIRYMVYSDGAGNVTLYINGTSVATTALGPTSTTTATTAQFTASTSSTASSTARVYFDLYHPKIFVAPQ